MHYDVHSRPQCVDGASAARRPRVGASAARRRIVGRPIWRVIATITPMRRRCVTVAKHWKSWKSHYNMTLITSFDAFDARGRRIVVHSWSGKLSVGRNASAAMRRPHVGRTSAARRPQCIDGASAAMRPTMYRP